jgi:nicotinamide mononucleotide transporter
MDLSLIIVEWAAVIFNVAYVVLAWYQKRICWVMGGIGSLLSIYYFQHEDVRLYAEAGLYAFYVIVAIYGYFAWNRKNDKPIHENTGSWHFQLMLYGVLLSGILSYLSHTYTDAAKPFADSLSTVFGVMATFMTIRKIHSSWIYWIFIDLFSVWLYWTRGAEVYAVQMFIFAILAYIGLRQWRKQQPIILVE